MKAEIKKYIIDNLEIDDDDIINDLLASYSESLTENVTKLSAALAAGESLAAGGIAHAIKGASANIGAQPIFEVAKQAELTLKAGNLQEGRDLFVKLSALVDVVQKEIIG